MLEGGFKIERPLRQTYVLHARLRGALSEVPGGAQSTRQRRFGRQFALQIRRERQLASSRGAACNMRVSLHCLPRNHSTDPALITLLKEHFQLVLQRFRVPVPGPHCVSAAKCSSPFPYKKLLITSIEAIIQE